MVRAGAGANGVRNPPVLPLSVHQQKASRISHWSLVIGHRSLIVQCRLVKEARMHIIGRKIAYPVKLNGIN